MSLADLRLQIPSLEGLSDSQALRYLQQRYAPDVPVESIAKNLGIKFEAAAAPPPPRRSLMAVANDTVIEAANAAAGFAGSVGNFISPGNPVSEFIDEKIIRAGEANQSDAVKADKAKFRQGLENADGFMDEIGAVGTYIKDAPLQALAQAAGSFVLPGAAVKAGGAVAGALGAGATGIARGGLAGGAVAGAAGAGGDAAGTAYELSRKAGATEEEATDAARGASVIPAIIGGAGGLVGAERLFAGAGGFKGGLMARALKTAGVEGLQEGVEEGVTQFEGQRAAMPFDPSIDPMKGVAGAAAMGAALGGATGAGVSLLTKRDEADKALDDLKFADTPEAAVDAALRATDIPLDAPAADLAPEDLAASPRARNADAMAEIRALEPAQQQEALGLIALEQRPGVSGSVRRYAQNRLDVLLQDVRQVPAAEATEFETIPTGDVTEGMGPAPRGPFRTPAEVAEDGRLQQDADLRRAPIPTGEAIEQVPVGEAMDLDPIPLPDVSDGGPAPLPEGMSPRTPKPKAPEPTTPMTDDTIVSAVVDGFRRTNTPQARAFVQEFEAGRITRDDVLKLVGRPPASPDERLAAAAAQAPKPAVLQPGDLLTGDGQPYGTRSGAVVRAKREGGDVIEVSGGWAVRPKESTSVDQRNVAAPAPLAVPAADAGSNRPANGLPTVGGVADAGRAGSLDTGLPTPAVSSDADSTAAPGGGLDAALKPADEQATAGVDALSAVYQKVADSKYPGRDNKPAADRMAAELKAMIDAKSADGLIARNLGSAEMNPASRAVFEAATGVKLPKGKAATEQAIDDWAGVTKEDRADRTKARKAQIDEKLARQDAESAGRLAATVTVKAPEGDRDGRAWVDGLFQQGFTKVVQRGPKTYLANDQGNGWPLMHKDIAAYARKKASVEAPSAPSRPATLPVSDQASGNASAARALLTEYTEAMRSGVGEKGLAVLKRRAQKLASQTQPTDDAAVLALDLLATRMGVERKGIPATFTLAEPTTTNVQAPRIAPEAPAAQAPAPAETAGAPAAPAAVSSARSAEVEAGGLTQSPGDALKQRITADIAAQREARAAGESAYQTNGDRVPPDDMTAPSLRAKWLEGYDNAAPAAPPGSVRDGQGDGQGSEAQAQEARRLAGTRWGSLSYEDRAQALFKAGEREIAPVSPWNNIGVDRQDRITAALATMPVRERQGNRKGNSPTPEAPAPAAPSANTVFTEEAAAAARARLKAKLGRLQSGIDPETMMDGITLAGYHIEKGARSFAAYARAMVDDLGDAVKPYLQSWYMATRADPRAGAFKADMDKASAVEDLDIDKVLAGPAPAKPAPLYASRPVTNAQDILAWAATQGFKTTLPAADLHVTVAYSREPIDGATVPAGAESVSIPGGKRTVEPLGSEGAVVLKFASKELQGRWSQYREAGASWDYESYTPHITLTYDGKGINLDAVEPYTGPIELGPEKQEALNEDKATDYKAAEVETVSTPPAPEPAPAPPPKPAKAAKPKKPAAPPPPTTDLTADDYAALQGKTIEQSVTMDDGKTATLRMDAAVALRQIDQRTKALNDLKTCLGRNG